MIFEHQGVVLYKLTELLVVSTFCSTNRNMYSKLEIYSDKYS